MDNEKPLVWKLNPEYFPGGTHAPSPLPVSSEVRSFGAFVAAEPFPDMSVKLQSHGEGTVKATRIENRTTGVWLKVVFAHNELKFLVGEKIMVGGKQFTQNWAKEVQVIDGKSFILVPETQILMVDHRVG